MNQQFLVKLWDLSLLFRLCMEKKNTSIGLIEEKEKIKEFLEIASVISIKCANAQFEAGADAVAIGEGGAGEMFFSLSMYKEFLSEIHKNG